MNTIENILKAGSEQIADGIAYANDKAIAIIAPSLIFGEDADGNHYISGPAKIIKITTITRKNIWSALIESGALIFGLSNEIKIARDLLRDPRTSRTASYILACSKNCHDFLQTIQRIESARFLIVGCGGIGSLISLNIAGAGATNITIVDGDTIEESNLNRQFFWEKKDIGKSKTAKLKETLENRFPIVRCHAIGQYIDEKCLTDLAANHDIIIISADEPLGFGNSSSHQISKNNHKLILSTGYFHRFLSVQAQPKNPEEVSPPTEIIYWRRGLNFVGPSFGPSNTELAGVVSSYAIHYILKKAQNCSMSFDAKWDSSLFPRTPMVK